MDKQMMEGAGYEALQITDALLQMRNEEQSRVLARFFKTGKGQYGEGDRFLENGAHTCAPCCKRYEKHLICFLFPFLLRNNAINSLILSCVCFLS